jgi:TonB family protein
MPMIRLHVLWKRVLPFVTALLVGVTAASLFYADVNPNDQPQIGSGSGTSSYDSEIYDAARAGNNKFHILQKPKALYTDLARENGVVGAVRLRVTLLANGEVGSVVPVTTLPDGLTEQAIAAARRIEFLPATRDGVPVSSAVMVEYTFTIY